MGAVEAPVVVDQEPVEAPQTEVAEEVVETPEVDAAAPAPETVAATEEETPQLEIPEERRYTEAELRAITAQAAQEALQRDQTRRQSENGRRAAEAQRAQQDESRLRDSVETALLKGGYAADDSVVSDLIQRVGNARGEIDQGRIASDVDMALEYVLAPVMGDARRPEDFTLTPGADAYARRVMPHLQTLIERLVPQIQASATADYVPKADIPKLVDAEIARRNAKAREGKTELTRVEGAPATTSNTLESWETRVAHQGEDGFPYLSDAQWHTYRQIRKDNGL